MKEGDLPQPEIRPPQSVTGSPECSRRDFLKATAAAGVAALLGPLGVRGEAASATTGTVVRYSSSLLGDGRGDFNSTVAGRALAESLKALLGVSDGSAAWRSLFSANDTVGIKVNCLAGARLSTHPSLALAVARGLQEAGVKPENIIIFDRSDRDLERAGFSLNRDGPGPRCYGTDAAGGYDSALTRQGSIATRLSRIQSTLCTAIVNMPVLKDHEVAGISGGMKNYYGVIDNPFKYHTNRCDPHLADTYAIPSIRGKERLIVCDALLACFDGGPGYKPALSWQANSLLVAQDLVALDYVAWYLVEQERQRRGVKPLAQVGRRPSYIYTAAAAGLGISNPEKSRLIELPKSG